MKQTLLETVAGLKEQGINLKEEHPLYKWSYPEVPEIQFQLLIMETDQLNLPSGETIQ